MTTCMSMQIIKALPPMLNNLLPIRNKVIVVGFSEPLRRGERMYTGKNCVRCVAGMGSVRA
jgi:hypothetical protein